MSWERDLVDFQAACPHPRFIEMRGELEGKGFVILRCVECAKPMQYPDEIARARATRSLAALKANLWRVT